MARRSVRKFVPTILTGVELDAYAAMAPAAVPKPNPKRKPKPTKTPAAPSTASGRAIKRKYTEEEVDEADTMPPCAYSLSVDMFAARKMARAAIDGGTRDTFFDVATRSCTPKQREGFLVKATYRINAPNVVDIKVFAPGHAAPLRSNNDLEKFFGTR